MSRTVTCYADILPPPAGPCLMTPIAMPRDLTVLSAASIAAETLDALTVLASRQPISLELDAVEKIDTAGIQLLLILQKEAREQGIDLRLSNMSEAVKELIAFYHLQDVLTMHADPEETPL